MDGLNYKYNSLQRETVPSKINNYKNNESIPETSKNSDDPET